MEREFMAVSKYKLPPHLIICGKKVLIKRVKRLTDYDGNELAGMFDSEKLAIFVSKSVRHNHRDTLLHEIIHAILFFSGHNELLGEKEEALVRALEHGLSDVLEIIYSPELK
jgi:hypothetical protein